jgi:hypothetical protein
VTSDSESVSGLNVKLNHCDDYDDSDRINVTRQPER